jgi:hypothetical protein
MLSSARFLFMGNNLTAAQILKGINTTIATAESVASVVIPAREGIPALLAYVEPNDGELDDGEIEYHAHAMVIIEPEERAIALSYVTAKSEGEYTEDGYDLKDAPYTPVIRRALLKAARAALLLVED